MAQPALAAALPRSHPRPGDVLELLKPLTWFPPVWAFGCGAVASGLVLARWPSALLGLLLVGPLVCGMSQAVNDWFDRHVDAVNEPDRPIPSGRIPGRYGLGIAIGWTVLSLVVGALLGAWGFAATLLGVALAWAYSAPPLRLKRNGWWGNAACALCYETLPWITAAAVLSGQAPAPRLVLVALLYGAGAHGIMTLNDFKSVEGDRRFGIRSLPVQLGPALAGRVACLAMALPQLVVAALLLRWGATWQAAAVAALLLGQLGLMLRLLRDPRRLAPWYGATGVSLYVLGMLASALALRPDPAG
jgi:chlorophyll/bacteriochlorophyll a synthase